MYITSKNQYVLTVKITSEKLLTCSDIQYGLPTHFNRLGEIKVENIETNAELQDKLHRRNMQIKELKKKLSNYKTIKFNSGKEVTYNLNIEEPPCLKRAKVILSK